MAMKSPDINQTRLVPIMTIQPKKEIKRSKHKLDNINQRKVGIMGSDNVMRASEDLSNRHEYVLIPRRRNTWEHKRDI